MGLFNKLCGVPQYAVDLVGSHWGWHRVLSRWHSTALHIRRREALQPMSGKSGIISCSNSLVVQFLSNNATVPLELAPRVPRLDFSQSGDAHARVASYFPL